MVSSDNEVTARSEGSLSVSHDQKKPVEQSHAEFDEKARNYDALFRPWLKIAGASREYFARGRVQWLSRRLGQHGVVARQVMDFGCGTGMSLPLLADILKAERVIGLDTSEESLAVARESVADRPSIELGTPANYLPRQDLDVVFCNGVFHHIPIPERPGVVDFVYRSLRPGGIFAFWENNTWNPIHAFAMKHSKIDRNAIPIVPPEARRLLSSGRFSVVHTDFLFFFPGYFRWLQPLETRLTNVPLGAQYLVLAVKNGHAE